MEEDEHLRRGVELLQEVDEDGGCGRWRSHFVEEDADTIDSDDRMDLNAVAVARARPRGHSPEEAGAGEPRADADLTRLSRRAQLLLRLRRCVKRGISSRGGILLWAL